jgi:hypothetical protein
MGKWCGAGGSLEDGMAGAEGMGPGGGGKNDDGGSWMDNEGITAPPWVWEERVRARLKKRRRGGADARWVVAMYLRT